VVKGKPVITEFLVKDQEGLDAAARRVNEPIPVDLEIDGFKLAALMTKTEVREMPGGTRVTREWFLASQPSILLRKDVNGEGWRVTSARVKKTIGDKDFSCIEIRSRCGFFSTVPASR
jgi:hypothetical protein